MVKKTKEQKERHKITQEDFTPVKIVNSMLNSLGDDVYSDPNKTFLDPSCGDGNFLVAVLSRKLTNCTDLECAKTSLKSIYGVELMADNVEKCRQRLYDTFVGFFPDVVNDNILTFKIRQIIRNRIQWHDSLKFNYEKWPTLKCGRPDKKHMNVNFNENKPSWNDIYPMWKEKPNDIEEKTTISDVEYV